MSLRIGYTILFLAVFFIAGGHWALLQGIAWTKMVVEYSQSSTIVSALEKTLSGRAPCELCQAIEKGREKETREPMTSAPKIGSFVTVPTSQTPRPFEKNFSYPPPCDEKMRLRVLAPPRPVPRKQAS